MKQNLRLGRIAGIPIGVQWSALAIVVLIALTLATGVLPSYVPGRPTVVYWAVALPGAAVFLACLLAHELAHSLVALRYGVKVGSITLFMLGGISELESEAPDPKADLAIAAAGPLTSLGIGALFGLAALFSSVLGWPALLTGSLGWLGLINVVLGAFNLLPGAPLDGGRVLRAVLWRRYHDRTRADLAAAHAGRALGLTMAFVGLAEFLFYRLTTGLWLMLMGWFLMAAAQAEQTSRMARQALRGLKAADVMTPRPDCGGAWQEVGDFVEHVLPSSRQDVFPVLDFDGTPVGAITATMLTRVPAEHRAIEPLRNLMHPLGEQNLCGPDAPVEDLYGKRLVAGRLVAVVLDGHQLVGMVTADDLARTVQLGMLKTPDETDKKS
ncbi:MAG: site-2 protease family protein [Actinomycetia bacterium]|jgi:Zn-dependent protease|nr:site-2 protease family protein [Actinomycetes bacterium]